MSPPLNGVDRFDFDGFDFTAHMRRLCNDVVRRLPELQHIDMDRVAVTFRQARKRVSYGIQATMTPLRFEGGSLEMVKRGRRWTVQRHFRPDGVELLYILSFYLPRFLDHSLREKLITIVHELWHIGPAFDGDLRRHPGRCYAHSHSQDEYDSAMAALVDRFLAADPDPQLYGFLELNSFELIARFRTIRGVSIKIPKLIRLPA